VIHLLVVLLTVASVLVAGSASAQDARVEARARFDAGAAAYAAGRYADALVHFDAAYELGEQPALLFDMGLTHERLGHDAEAVTMYERYLAARPDAPSRAHVRRRIAAARSRIEAAASAGSSTPYVFGAIALVSAGAAGAFWLVGDGQYAELEETCAARGCTPAEISDSSVRTWDLLTNLALGVAALAAAACVVLFVTRSDGDDEAPAVVLGPGTIAVRGSL
jgi:tetratricopeptide (TPR) repeat protein